MRFRIPRLAAASLVLCSPLLMLGPLFPGQAQTAAAPGADTVLVKVSVLDRLNRYVSDIDKSNFSVREDKAAQTISYFAHKTAPSTMAVVISAAESAGIAASAVIDRMLKAGNSGDEIILIPYEARTAQVQVFGQRGLTSDERFEFGRVAGETPLAASMTLGMDQLKKRSTAKKALVVVTSAYLAQMHRDFPSQAYTTMKVDFRLYLICRTGGMPSLAPTMVEQSNGNTYMMDEMSRAYYYLELIHSELQSEYVLGYVSTNRNHDGAWRKISVEVKPPAGSPKLTVRATKGYYAPTK